MFKEPIVKEFIFIMKTLILDVYQIIFKVTGLKGFSVFIALLYVTLFNLILLNGIGQLLQDWQKSLGLIHKLFVFPVFLITGLVMLYISYASIKPIEDLSKNRNREVFYVPVILYTIAGLLAYCYIQFADKLFA